PAPRRLDEVHALGGLPVRRAVAGAGGAQAVAALFRTRGRHEGDDRWAGHRPRGVRRASPPRLPSAGGGNGGAKREDQGSVAPAEGSLDRLAIDLAGGGPG